MARKFLFSSMAIIVTLAMVLAGCGGGEPTGEPVEVIMLIRSDLAPYPEAGQYVADLVEDLGFEVTRLERTGGEAAPIWLGDPNSGEFHAYTGGWISPVIPRDSSDIFDQMYTHRVMPYGLWTVLEEQLEDFPEFDEASRKLSYKQFSNMAEREELFETVLWGAMEFSNTIWTCDVAGANPFGLNVSVKGDLAGGIGDPSWVHTAHFVSEGDPVPGGTLQFAQPNLLLDPWNPVEGSSWAYDMVGTRRALGDLGVLPDPDTGLYWPQRVESAEVTYQEDLPVVRELDWLTATDAAEIVVPGDAWADWDAEAGEWITTAEKFDTGNTTAQMKISVTYPSDIYDTELHDGSTLSLGDFVMRMIYEFDRGKEDSPVYDASRAADVEATLDQLKGFKIVDDGLNGGQLTIETYTDTWYMDAEENVAAWTWFPAYGTYDWTGFWHMITVGWLAEKDNELAFSEDKAGELEVDWMDYTKGDSLPILEAQMDWAHDNDFIPYSTTLSDYIDLAEIQARWDNLQTFYDTYGHFWVGNGPYILDDVAPTARIVTLDRFENYDLAADWFLELLGETITTTRTGSWVDEVLLTVVEDHAQAVSQLKAGDIDIYAHGITEPTLYADIEANLNYMINYGSYRELRFNTAGPFFTGTGKLNPFHYPAIREAMNLVIDRDYIVDEFLGGLGTPKWTALGTQFPDNVDRYPDIVAAVEAAYAEDFDAADAAIEAVMLTIEGVSRDETTGQYLYLAP